MPPPPLFRMFLLLAAICFTLLGTVSTAASSAPFHPQAAPPLYSASAAADAAFAAAAGRHRQLMSRLSSHSKTIPQPHRSHSPMSFDASQHPPSHGLFPPRFRFSLNAFGRRMDIELDKNEQVVGEEYKHISHSGSSLKPSRNCYYHGRVAGDPSSWVAVNTCHGLSGVMHAHGDTFAITPNMEMDDGDSDDDQDGSSDEAAKDSAARRASKPRSKMAAPRHMHSMSASHEEQHEKMTTEHVVYKLSDYKPLRTRCGVESGSAHEHPLAHFHPHAETLLKAATAAPGSVLNAQNTTRGSSGTILTEGGFRLNYATAPADDIAPDGREKRFVELLVINDYDRHQQHGANTEHDSLALVNMVDSYYRVAQTKYLYRIVLVGQATFINGDPYKIPYLDGAANNPPNRPADTTPQMTPPSGPSATPPTPPAEADSSTGSAGAPDATAPPETAPPASPDQPGVPTPAPAPTTPTDLNVPDLTQPTQPYNPYAPYQPAQPNPYQPAPNPYQPAQPNPYQPAQPNPYQPAQPNPYQPYQPYQPTQPYQPYQPAQPSYPYIPYSGQGSTQQPANTPAGRQGTSYARASGAAVQTQGGMGLLEVFNAWHAADKDLPKRDNTQLFSGLNFASGVLGLANVGMSCYPDYSGSVCAINEPSDVQNAVIAAHETGHTLGMSHDSMGNSCPPSGFIMAAVAGVGDTFSTCSVKYLNDWADAQEQPGPNTCLNDVPSVWINSDSNAPAAPASPTPAANGTDAPATPASLRHAGKSASHAADSQGPAESPFSTFKMLLLGSACFATGMAAMWSLSQWMKARDSQADHSLAKQQHARTKSAAATPDLALHVAPSAPNTPAHATSAHLHADENSSAAGSSTGAPERGSFSGPSSSLPHLTKAKRRPSFTAAHLNLAPTMAVPATIPSESPEVDADDAE